MRFGSGRRIPTARPLGRTGMSPRSCPPGRTARMTFVRLRILFLLLFEKRKNLKAIANLEVWQREKDSNPHKQSQSLSCYPYTIPLFHCAVSQRQRLLYQTFSKCQLFFKNFLINLAFNTVRLAYSFSAQSPALRQNHSDGNDDGSNLSTTIKKEKTSRLLLTSRFGSGRRIRTLTNRVRVCRATLTQSRCFFCAVLSQGQVLLYQTDTKCQPHFSFF